MDPFRQEIGDFEYERLPSGSIRKTSAYGYAEGFVASLSEDERERVARMKVILESQLDPEATITLRIERPPFTFNVRLSRNTSEAEIIGQMRTQIRNRRYVTRNVVQRVPEEPRMATQEIIDRLQISESHFNMQAIRGMTRPPKDDDTESLESGGNAELEPRQNDPEGHLEEAELFGAPTFEDALPKLDKFISPFVPELEALHEQDQGQFDSIAKEIQFLDQLSAELAHLKNEVFERFAAVYYDEDRDETPADFLQTLLGNDTQQAFRIVGEKYIAFSAEMRLDLDDKIYRKVREWKFHLYFSILHSGMIEEEEKEFIRDKIGELSDEAKASIVTRFGLKDKHVNLSKMKPEVRFLLLSRADELTAAMKESNPNFRFGGIRTLGVPKWAKQLVYFMTYQSQTKKKFPKLRSILKKFNPLNYFNMPLTNYIAFAPGRSVLVNPEGPLNDFDSYSTDSIDYTRLNDNPYSHNEGDVLQRFTATQTIDHELGHTLTLSNKKGWRKLPYLLRSAPYKLFNFIGLGLPQFLFPEHRPGEEVAGVRQRKRSYSIMENIKSYLHALGDGLTFGLYSMLTYNDYTVRRGENDSISKYGFSVDSEALAEIFANMMNPSDNRLKPEYYQKFQEYSAADMRIASSTVRMDQAYSREAELSELLKGNYRLPVGAIMDGGDLTEYREVIFNYMHFISFLGRRFGAKINFPRGSIEANPLAYFLSLITSNLALLEANFSFLNEDKFQLVPMLEAQVAIIREGLGVLSEVKDTPKSREEIQMFRKAILRIWYSAEAGDRIKDAARAN